MLSAASSRSAIHDRTEGFYPIALGSRCGRTCHNRKSRSRSDW
jgi:hypothetical protein